jgi:peptidoglycan/LPS O-acetylase OafA/YrhL
VTELVFSLLRPYYHLWYVPAVVLMTLGLKALLRRFPATAVLIPALSIGIAYALLRFYFYHDLQKHYPTLFQVFIIIRKYHPDFFYFFLLGFILRADSWRPPPIFIGLLILMGVCMRVYLYEVLPLLLPGHSFWGFFRFPDFFLLKTALILFLPHLLSVDLGPVVRWLGANSLPVYLYHPLFIFLGKELAAGAGVNPYFYTLPLLLIFPPIIYLGTRIKWVNRILFGAVHG